MNEAFTMNVSMFVQQGFAYLGQNLRAGELIGT